MLLSFQPLQDLVPADLGVPWTQLMAVPGPAAGVSEHPHYSPLKPALKGSWTSLTSPPFPANWCLPAGIQNEPKQVRDGQCGSEEPQAPLLRGDPSVPTHIFL